MDIMNLRDAFIRNLKFYRKQKGLRQIDLALELNKNTNYINSIENYKYFPSPETVEEIANILGIDPMQLFNYEDPSVNKPIKIDTKEVKIKLENEVVRSIEKAFSVFQ